MHTPQGMNMLQGSKLFSLIFLVILLMGCGKADSPAEKPLQGQLIKRQHDPEKLVLGKKVYDKFCSRCHGKQAQGAENWRKRGVDKKFPPPPLNGTGHAWHHPRHILQEVIRDGVPDGNMPAWKTTLTEKQIDAVIEWFQSLWPNELYEAWAQMDKDSQ